jgi:hypothetical protein
MIPQTSITLPLTAYIWPMGGARTEGFARITVNVAKRNHRLAQGCFPMTD